MPRKRFNTAEKRMIAQGGEVEWQNVTQWHRARLLGKGIRTDDGWQSVEAINLEGTKRISKGAMIFITPGHIRERVSA